MAEGNAKEMNQTYEEEIEECAICYNAYKDPRRLDCSHWFCLCCLQELKKTQSECVKNITCPVCRRQTALPQEGIDMLPKRDQNKEELFAICQACEEGSKATFRCLDCRYLICKGCENAHLSYPPLRAHKIVSLTEQETVHFANKRGLKDTLPKCDKHPDQDVCFYCNSCSVLICNICTDFEHKTSMHCVDNIDRAFDQCIQEINKAMSETKQCIQDFISAYPASIEHSRNRLAVMLRKTNNQISKRAEKEIARIREKETELKKNAQIIATKKDQEFAYVTTSEQSVSIVNKMITTASCIEILKSKKKLLFDLEKPVETLKSSHINHNKSFIGFKERSWRSELGSLLETEKWWLMETVKMKDVKHIAVYSSGNIAVAGSREIFTLSPTGEVLSKRTYNLQKDSEASQGPENVLDIHDPTALAVNKDDELLVLDGPAVKTFNQEYQLLHQFTLGTESSSPPTCLAVGDNYLIAVGYKDKEEISLHKPDGSLIRTLPAPRVDKHLTISHKRLIYTNTSRGMLLAIDFNGCQIFTVNTDGNPSGLCCDEAGDIYLAEGCKRSVQTSTRRKYQYYYDTLYETIIKHYSKDGNFIEAWTTSTARYESNCTQNMDVSSFDVAFNSEGKIVVAGYNNKVEICICE